MHKELQMGTINKILHTARMRNTKCTGQGLKLRLATHYYVTGQLGTRISPALGGIYKSSGIYLSRTLLESWYV